MYVYCVFPAMSKSSKQVQNYLKIAGTSIFNGGLCKICACTVTICKKIRYQNSNILVSDRI